MLAENIKSLRKQRGYSQEMLAQQLNVVRQTVSKWEKGLSVPDAEMLERIAETFEVSVGVLLGETLPDEAEQGRMDEIARQLAIMNEHFARQSARRRRLRKIILTAAAVLLLIISLLAYMFGFRPPQTNGELDSYTEALSHAGMWCELEGETYYYEISFNDEGEIRIGGGDSFVEELISDKYGDASRLMAEVEDYFTGRGGSVRFVGDMP
ncbi:MAG: helix-turn-helix transcriptional regulator [Clostridia bacterium]|nr:helix-turn-helix transcriptional regulator [Oscillospiraceae bacterium]MBQ9733256.1 helix-turn-helix transcriptional regulator [Clostridia bacterium]